MGQYFPLTFKRLGINGEGVGFYKRKIVFVPGAIPGEEVVMEAKSFKKNWLTPTAGLELLDFGLPSMPLKSVVWIEKK